MQKIVTLKKREDFLRVARGVKVVSNNIILQAAFSLEKEEKISRVGFTATKRIGKAHVRNLAKRRMRGIVRDVFPSNMLEGADYVLVARYNTANCDFAELEHNLKKALPKINKLLSGE